MDTACVEARAIPVNVVPKDRFVRRNGVVRQRNEKGLPRHGHGAFGSTP